MSSESSKSLVIISSGVDHPPLLQNFLEAGLQFTILLNTTSDFFLPDEDTKNGLKEVWYHHEIIKLASSMIPDDFAQSSLAKIFTKPLAQTKVPLTDAERFLTQWVSEQHKANQDFTEFFKVLSEYSNKQVSVYPLKFPKEVIELKTENHIVPLRYFQTTGFIDRKSEEKPDLEELQLLLNESNEEKGKKKPKPKIAVIGLDKKRDILTEPAKKALENADAILLLASDPCSLSALLLHNEFTNAIKESNAPVSLVCPTRFSFREQFILELLSVKPNLGGITELCTGIVDHLVVGPDDASEVKTLRSQGFNVLMEDLTKIKDNKGLSAILKGLGVSLSDISVESKGIDKKLSLEELVTQLTFSTAQEDEQPDLAETVEESETTVELDSEPSLQSEIETTSSVKLQDVDGRNYDFEDPSLMLTQEMIESLMEELSEDFPEKSEKILEEKITEENQTMLLDSQEVFTEAIDTIIRFEDSNNKTELKQNIHESIVKDTDRAGYAAKKLTAALDSSKSTTEFLNDYLYFMKPRPLIFTKELVDWLVTDMESPDYVTFSQKALILYKMSRINIKYVQTIVEELVTYRMTQELNIQAKEHLRTLIGMITARDVALQRQAIRTYLSYYEKVKKPDEIWLGLLKYDAGLVALEIIEHQSKTGVIIVQDALKRDFGSYGHIVYEVFAAYQKGDLQKVLATAGPLSDGLVKKNKRIELAEKITKFGSVPIETLAKSVEIEPEELETLVYEMINENEINAKIEVVEGRLCIVQLGEKEKEEEN